MLVGGSRVNVRQIRPHLALACVLGLSLCFAEPGKNEMIRGHQAVSADGSTGNSAVRYHKTSLLKGPGSLQEGSVSMRSHLAVRAMMKRLSQMRTGDTEAVAVSKLVHPDGVMHFQWFGEWENLHEVTPLGNSLMFYWNARALAMLRGVGFEAGPITRPLFNELPRSVPKVSPSAEMVKAHALLQSVDNDVCWNCWFPHKQNEYAPWLLIEDTILKESMALKEKLGNSHPWARHKHTAAVHIRCDDYILSEHDDYGLIPHSFVLDNLPSHITRVVLVSTKDTLGDGPPNHASGKCTRAVWDLKENLENRHVIVEMGTPEVIGDDVANWRFLSDAQVVFGAPSTFSFSALLGNPNTVFFPRSGNRMAIRTPGQLLSQTAPGSLTRDWHWKIPEFLGGTAINKMEWPEVQKWLNSA